MFVDVCCILVRILYEGIERAVLSVMVVARKRVFCVVVNFQETVAIRCWLFGRSGDPGFGRKVGGGVFLVVLLCAVVCFACYV